MTTLFAWLNANSVAVLGVVVLASRIWSHFEHRANQRQSASNAAGIAEVHILMNSRMAQLLEEARLAAHAEGIAQERTERRDREVDKPQG